MSIRAGAVWWLVVAQLAACGGGSHGRPWFQSDAGGPRDSGKPPGSGLGAFDAAAQPSDAAAAGRRVDAAVSGGPTRMTPEQLRDPEMCKSCHPKHYQEWSSSMHAYAALDPVFIAMNKRGQRETNGALGDFCVKCHAPMAVADGFTTDGLNLDQLPDQKRGVSCYFCHNAVEVLGDHNGNLRVANDNVMRGPFSDAVESGAHGSAVTELFDHARPEHNAMCGGCHDIVLDNGVELERTFREFKSGLYGQQAKEGQQTLENCAGCHMTGRNDVVAVAPAGAPKRVAHEHLWPGIDVALTEFPNKAAMRSAIEDCQLGLASVAFFTLKVTPPNVFEFNVETNAGHNQPSGAAQDRRMWLEISAFDSDGKLIASSSSGIIGDQEIEEKPTDDPRHDPRLWMFRDRIFDSSGKPTHMFWEAAPSVAYPQGYESDTLDVRKETLGFGTHFISKSYTLAGANGEGAPARVTARLRMRPIGMDVLQDLVESGDLEAEVLKEMPTFSFRAQLEWTDTDGLSTTVSAQGSSDCVNYRCSLDPSSSGCPEMK